MTTQKTMNKKLKIINNKSKMRNGFILPLVIVAVLILVALATGLIMASFGVRMQAVKAKSETEAMLAAEAGYEQGIFWMSQQPDILGALQDSHSGASGTIEFGSASCSYEVSFDDFIGARPVFKILSTGTSGITSRVVDVTVVQEITGWAMGKCRVPSGSTSTNPVYFANGEILDIPIHINNLKDSPDNRDIYISGSPQFKQKLDMGESRQTPSGADKYTAVIDLFEKGINFDQPDVRITDSAAVLSKVNRFRDSTNPVFRFYPAGTAIVPHPHGAVQLEFFVDSGVGKVRITNDCTVEGFTGGPYDYNIVSEGTYKKYDIYAYHYVPRGKDPNIVPLSLTYVTQKFGAKESEPGGQIFVNGDVIIGGGDTACPNSIVLGKMTIVATGNIWIADSISVAGAHDANGMPSADNTNVLGLIAQGVVKIIDPGLSNKSNPAPPVLTGVQDKLHAGFWHDYKPVALADGGAVYNRVLPHTMIVEAAVTVGGGGWGAENVGSSGGGRKEKGPGSQDFLILRGAVSECVRGVVGLVGSDGYIKRYYLDNRLLEGILPGDIWFGGKYVPAPAGWHDYRPEE